ncbi:chymotrypsin-1-like [Amphiura filiformis]|uniref:chymotrypsin-1-like n=1 Tax=Amphiura filiformis TaxID=82378 RepID=UPI003B213DC3
MGSIWTLYESTFLPFCSVTMLDNQFGITLRACAELGIFVVFGDHNLMAPSTTHVESFICGVFMNQDDEIHIAVLKFCTPITFNSQVAPICLNTRADKEEEEYSTSQCKILGFGETSTGGGYPATLNEATVSLSDCGLSSEYVCVEGSTGLCTGDGGSPLVCEGDDGNWRLVGIGLHLACDTSTEHPYVRVSRVQSLIAKASIVDSDCANLGAMCTDDRCYFSEGKCDGVQECLTGEDEVNCHASCVVVVGAQDNRIALKDQPDLGIRISSDNYPNQYANDLECVWWFSSPEGSNIVIYLLDFSVEENYDFVHMGSGVDHVQFNSVCNRGLRTRLQSRY